MIDTEELLYCLQSIKLGTILNPRQLSKIVFNVLMWQKRYDFFWID